MSFFDQQYQPNELNNPEAWYQKANSYQCAARTIMNDFREMQDGVPLNDANVLKVNAMGAIPYLTGLALELILKGFLISSGMQVSEVIAFGHDLRKLRARAEEINTNWKNTSLQFVCDKLGPIIMGEKKDKNKKGGIRYPGIRDIAVYSDFEHALIVAQRLTHTGGPG